jgi:hypothetical protein
MPISVFVTEIALALNHMHNKGIIYRSVIRSMVKNVQLVLNLTPLLPLLCWQRCKAE